MAPHDANKSAEELGHAVFQRMTELVQLAHDPASTADDIDAARARLRRCHTVVGQDADGSPGYDAGLRSAMMTHLNMCESARRDPVTLVSPRSPEETRALKAQAQAIQAGLDDLDDLSPVVRERVAALFLANADLSDAIRDQGEGFILVLQGLQGRAVRDQSPPPSLGGESDWRAAGRRHWALSMTTATHGDDDPACQTAHDQLEILRALIPDLSAAQCREYLAGLLEEVEDFAWHGL